MQKLPPFRLAILLVSAVAPALPGQELSPNSAEVRAEGTAERSIRPDLATLNLGFAAVDTTPTLAAQRRIASDDRAARQILSVAPGADPAR